MRLATSLSLLYIAGNIYSYSYICLYSCCCSWLNISYNSLPISWFVQAWYSVGHYFPVIKASLLHDPGHEVANLWELGFCEVVKNNYCVFPGQDLQCLHAGLKEFTIIGQRKILYTWSSRSNCCNGVTLHFGIYYPGNPITFGYEFWGHIVPWVRWSVKLLVKSNSSRLPQFSEMFSQPNFNTQPSRKLPQQTDSNAGRRK